MDHTQNKLTIHKLDHLEDSYSIKDDKGYPIVSIVSGLDNANLMASANDLYETLIACKLVFLNLKSDNPSKTDFNKWYDFVSKKIAKAEGE